MSSRALPNLLLNPQVRCLLLFALCCATAPVAAEASSIDCVDPFIGTASAVLPKPEGIVAVWWSPKPAAGHTHPGAVTPHGMVSVTAWGNGYPTGYRAGQVIGFTHFQQFGAGNLGQFYNFMLVVPSSGEATTTRQSHPAINEVARPGYYAVDIGGTGVRGEVTVTRRSAFHRYHFPAGKPAHLLIDLTRNSQEKHMGGRPPSLVTLVADGPRAVSGSITFANQPIIHFHLVSDLPGSELRGWSGEVIGDVVPASMSKPPAGAGIIFSAPAVSRPVQLKIGFSLRSAAQAKANLASEAPGWDFAATAQAATELWRTALDRIQVEGGSDEQRHLFTSALYRSLIKPIDLTGESPFWADDRPLYLDIGTIWDTYKNQLPMLIAFYPERGSAIVTSLIATMQRFAFDHPTRLAYLIHQDQGTGFTYQGTGFAHQAILQARAAGVPGIDWAAAYPVLLKAMGSSGDKRIDLSPKHVVDDAYTSSLMAAFAAEQGDAASAATFGERAQRWRSSYDPLTAQLRGVTYEGLAANYGWQVWHDLPGLIALHGGPGPALLERDRFFGFERVPDTMAVWTADGSGNPIMGAKVPGGMRMGHFQGLNNQTDIDSFVPYYHLGRPDRAVDVIRAALAYRFALGRGGLPGNDDSGGTSSWFVTNAIGLQPVCGSGRFYIGSPIFRRVTVALGKQPLVIETTNASVTNRYVVSASWRGAPLDRPYLLAAEIAQGGRLVLDLGPKALAWVGWHEP